MVFNPDIPGWSDNLSPITKYYLICQNWQSIQSYLQSLSQHSGMDGIIIQNFTIGSVIVNAIISQTPSQDPLALYSTISKNLNTINSTNFTLLASSLAATGFNPANSTETTSSNSNSIIIIAIAAGGGLLVVIVIIGKYIDI
jgi:hypothetical protein